MVSFEQARKQEIETARERIQTHLAQLHPPVTEGSPLVGIIEGAVERGAAKVVDTPKRGGTHQAIARQALVMGRVSLEDVTVDGLRSQAMKLRRQRSTVRAARPLKGVQAALSAVHIANRVALEMTPRTAQALVVHSHVDQSGLLAVVPSKLIEMLTLKLVLDALAVGSVTNQGEDRSNAFDKKGTLCGLGVIQGSLDAVVAVRIPEQLFEASSVKKLLDEHFASGVLRDTNTLLDDIGTELLDR